MFALFIQFDKVKFKFVIDNFIHVAVTISN